MRLTSRLFQRSVVANRRTNSIRRVRRYSLDLARLEDRTVPALISGTVFHDLNNNGILNIGEPGIANQKVYLDLNGNNAYDSPVFVNSGPGSVGVVPDSDPLGVDLTLTTSGYTGPLTGLKVNFDATMTWDGDVVAMLKAPNGTEITLFSNVGGSGDNFTGTVFDDYAAVSITAGAPPFTGSFRPSPGSLSAFNGLTGTDLNGNWNLHLFDVAGGDTMTVNSWSLEIGTGGDAATLSDAVGAYSFNVANGTYDVRADPPSGIIGTVPAGNEYNVTVTGPDVTGRDFGQLEANSIRGRVFEDRNNNGVQDPGEAGLAGRTVFRDENNNGIIDSGAPVNSGPGTVGAVPDSDPAGIDFQLITSGYVGTLSSMTVNFDATMTWDGDITAVLIAPNGTKITLFSGVGGSGDNFTGTIFDDAAAVSITAGAPPFTGSFKPSPGALSTFGGLSGANLNGTWTLHLTDSAGGDIMTVNSWSLDISMGEVSTKTDANGDYVFLGQPAGAYRIVENTPAGWNRLSPAGSYTGTLVNGTAVAGLNYLEARQNTVYGKTYFDTDSSGTLTSGDTGVGGVLVYVDANSNGMFDVGLTVNSGPGSVGSVPDSSPAGIDLPLITSGYTGAVADVNVNFDATMTWDGDITATLIAPNGTSVVLFSGVGGSGDNFTNTVLDDQAATSITAGAPPFTGSFQPAPGKLSAFNGLTGANLNGTWTLHLVDSAGGDIMTVNSWSLDITTGESGTVSDVDGNYALTGLTAGTFDVRSVSPTGLISNGDPAGGKYSVTIPANGTAFNKDFGHIPDPRPVAVGSGAKVGQPSAGGSSTTVTVVYTDNYNTVIDAGTLGTDDIRIKAPDGTFLLPTAFVATPNTNAKTISVDYTIPALGGSWDNTDNGVYSIEVIAGKVFDQDTITTVLGTGPYSAQAGKVGSFIVGLDTSYVVGLDGSVDDGNTTTPAQTTVVEALRLANADFGNTTITFSIPTGSATLGGEVFVNQDLTVTGPAGGFTLNAAAGKRLFNIDIEGSAVVFSNLTLTGGDAGAGNGGAILANNENVTLNNVTVTANKATRGSSIAFSGSGGSLTLDDSTISNNTATAGGTIFFNGTTDFTMEDSIVTGNNAAQIVGIWFNAFTGGSVNIGDSTISNNTGTSFSGGALYFSGTVGAKGAKINNSVISGNTNNFGGFLGLLFVDGKFEVNNSRIENNTSKLSGGAVIAAYGNTQLDIVNTSITGNKALSGSGGGIAAFSPLDLTVIHSTIADNEATGSGGGIFFSYGGSLVVESSTISGNKANTSGTALGGGAIYFYGPASKFEINNSTISGNTAAGIDPTYSTPTGYGGGILLNGFSGSPVIRNSTIVFNDAGVDGGGIAFASYDNFNISSSIISKNTVGALNTAKADLFSLNPAVVTGEFNIIGIDDVANNFTFSGANQLGTLASPLDPMLGALGLNGAAVGSPQTHKPLPGSPAIDKGNNGSGLINDERGGKRTYDDPAIANAPGGDGTDVGAVEIQTAPTVVVLTNGQVSGQHSRVTSFVVTFDQPVTITSPSTAFTIFRTAGIGSDTTTGNVGYDVAGLGAGNVATTVTITFNDSGAIDPEFGSLRDGKYTVTVNGVGGVTGLDTAMTTNPVTNTWRLFGDVNGDGAVTAVEFNAFRLVYGTSGDPFAAPFDFDNNGSISATDFNQFRTRYGVSGLNIP